MLLMHQPSRRSVAVSLHKVNTITLYFERVRADRWHPLSQISKKKKSKVWGVIWLIIAFIFFISGVLVGLVAFKVRCSHKQILRYILSLSSLFCNFCSCVCLVGIGGSATTRCEALFACSRNERRNSDVTINTACSITQHLVICITRFAVIIGIAFVHSQAISARL